MENKKTNKSLVVGVVIISCAILIFGFFKIKRAIFAPFYYPRNFKPLTQEDVVNQLKSQDTDKDGLSNFDEKFTYRTSVYLSDSDSDGFSDKEEIDAKSNPLDSLSTPYNKKVSQANPSEQVVQPLENLSKTNLSAEEIKNLLINKGGFSQDFVNKLDDKTLIKLYNETKEETGIDLEKLQIPQDVSGQFSDLNIDDLRKLLINQGIDKDKLDKISDAELKTLFMQSFQK